MSSGTGAKGPGRWRAVGVLAIAVASLGCPGEGPTQPAAPAPTSQPASQPTQGLLARGPVLETFEGGGYTYVHVDAGETKVWAAGPRTDVAVGDVVEIPQGMVMRNFRSSSLERTFPEIHFVESLSLRATFGRVLTVGQVLARSVELKDAVVSVRGLVARATKTRERTWLHIQDKDGNDLSVSTHGDAQVGDTVICEGVLRLDVDHDGVLRFPVLLEDASVGLVPMGHPVGAASSPPRPTSRPAAPTSQPASRPAASQTADAPGK